MHLRGSALCGLDVGVRLRPSTVSVGASVELCHPVNVGVTWECNLMEEPSVCVLQGLPDLLPLFVFDIAGRFSANTRRERVCV